MPNTIMASLTEPDRYFFFYVGSGKKGSDSYTRLQNPVLAPTAVAVGDDCSVARNK